jgi:hypothetical protein
MATRTYDTVTGGKANFQGRHIYGHCPLLPIGKIIEWVLYMATAHFCRSDFSTSGHIYGYCQLLPGGKVSRCPLLPIGKIIEWPYIRPLPTFAARESFKVAIYLATGHFRRSAKSSSGHIDGHSQLYRATSGKYEICMSASGCGSGCLPHYTVIPLHSFLNKNRHQDGWITSVQLAVI